MAVKESEVKKVLRSLLVSSALKVTVCSLKKDYYDVEGRDIPFKELGYNSLQHFLHSIPDVLQIKGTSDHAEITLVVSEKTAHVNELVMKQKKPSKGKLAGIARKKVVHNQIINAKTLRNICTVEAPLNTSFTFVDEATNNQITGVNTEEMDKYVKIPQQIQLNLQNLISKFPQGLSCSQLPYEYKKIYKEEFDYQKYGFLSLIHLCISLDNIFKWEKESTYDYILYDRRQHIPKILVCPDDDYSLETYANTDTSEIDPLSTIPLESSDWDEYSEFVPDDVLKLGEKIEKCSSNDFIVGHRIPIVISAVYNPSKFCIYKDDRTLNRMMDCMQQYYKHNTNNYLIPEFMLEKGLYCAVNTLGEFQRGLIVDLLSEVGGYVKVYFIDYGIEQCISREKIWFLNKEFSHLPAQAIRVQLSNIQPVKHVWNKQSTHRFLDFVKGKHILATISMIEEGNIAVYISEAHYPSKFLNDMLVEEGFATYSNKKIIPDAKTAPSRKSDMSKLLDRIRAKKMMNSFPPK
ncbi:hypothetical protein WA026_011889 [Henosepilachna vigintioctopunctata]|uniref:Tudor domain-containing protein 5 n=1 Tax=Henosepilachna vigintioctopunctata TaxID=420089 RepID=A0AAW1UHQ9_9CUCU